MEETATPVALQSQQGDAPVPAEQDCQTSQAQIHDLPSFTDADDTVSKAYKLSSKSKLCCNGPIFLKALSSAAVVSIHIP